MQKVTDEDTNDEQPWLDTEGTVNPDSEIEQNANKPIQVTPVITISVMPNNGLNIHFNDAQFPITMLYAAAELLRRHANNLMDSRDMQQAMDQQQMAAVRQELSRPQTLDHLRKGKRRGN